MRDRVTVAADHHAIAPLDAPHAAAGPDVEVAYALGFEPTGTAHIILVMGVATVDQDVVAIHAGAETHHRRLSRVSGRQHHPDGTRLVELDHQIIERGRCLGALTGKVANRRSVAVEHHAVVTMAHQPAHDVSAHPAKADHAQLHRALPSARS